jgi:membrane protein implicated in regulation of membrane protease activity
VTFRWIITDAAAVLSATATLPVQGGAGEINWWAQGGLAAALLGVVAMMLKDRSTREKDRDAREEKQDEYVASIVSAHAQSLDAIAKGNASAMQSMMDLHWKYMQDMTAQISRLSTAMEKRVAQEDARE